MSDAALLSAARALAPRIRPRSAEIEANRGLPADLVEELSRAGLFRMLVPRAFGGGEVAPLTMLRAIEEIAWADGSAGWCVMVGAGTGLLAAYLEEDVAREVYSDPLVVASGVFAPLGRATEEGDCYRVSGRWPFASGVAHSALRMGGAVLMGEGGPLLSPGGEPLIRHILFRAEETQILDTWTVSGLCGTGSHDMVVEAALVPRGRSVSLGVDRPRHPGVLYKLPLFGLLALSVASVALGIARAAIDAFCALATQKKPLYSNRSLAQREVVQVEVAKAEALVRAARAFVLEVVAEATEGVEARGELLDKERALLRLAATQATMASAQAVDQMYTAGGGTSVYAASPLQRYFRDIHVVTQHAMVAPAIYGVVGKVLLGVGKDAGML
jgi:alkylation response protein AidB-like acyl-CoA dehydrogenase